MFNHVDTRQVEALVDHRREQVATDVTLAGRTVENSEIATRRVGSIRAAIGISLIRVGARIAGVYVKGGPHLSPGV